MSEKPWLEPSAGLLSLLENVNGKGVDLSVGVYAQDSLQQKLKTWFLCPLQKGLSPGKNMSESKIIRSFCTGGKETFRSYISISLTMT